MKMYNILLIEDDEIDAIQIQRTFKDANITNKIIHAIDGQDAKEIIEQTDKKDLVPLLILLDLNMPRMNGLEFLEWFRKLNNELSKSPVVIMTTSSEERDILNAHQLGISSYIVKPVDITQFHDVTSLIGQYWSLCKF